MFIVLFVMGNQLVNHLLLDNHTGRTSVFVPGEDYFSNQRFLVAYSFFLVDSRPTELDCPH